MGFNWDKGPVELLQDYGLKRFIDKANLETNVSDFLTKILDSQDNPYG